MKILATGITGLIGWNFWKNAKRHLPEDAQFIAIANKRYSELDMYDKSIFYRKISDFHKIGKAVSEIKPDVIVHMAGICDLDVCEFRKKDTFHINVEGTKSLLRATKENQVQHFIYVSCDHVFSGNNPPYKEDSTLDPISIYGESRVEAEGCVEEAEVPWTILRVALTIGESLQGNTGPLDWFKTRTLRGRRADYFTDEIRSVILATDVTKSLCNVIKEKITGVYHIGGPKSLNRYELASVFTQLYPGTKEHIYNRLRRDEEEGPPRVGNLTFNCTKAKRKFGFDPEPVNADTIRENILTNN